MQDVQLINRIGVRLGSDPERILDRLDRDAITEADIEYTPDHVASDHIQSVLQQSTHE
jgi:D-lactate dehydrogenase (quinone)